MDTTTWAMGTMMKQLRLKDNTQMSREALWPVSGLVEKIADKTLKELEKEGIFVFPELVKNTADLTGEQFVLKSYNRSFRSSNVMGFLGYGEEQLIIASRFSSSQNDYFLRYLLEKVLFLPNVMDMKTQATPNHNFWELFVFLFPTYLKRAARKGLFKVYTTQIYNDSNPKGTLDMARHLKQNTPFVGKIAYWQREHTYDNALTQLIRHTIEFIKKQPYGDGILSKAKAEVMLVIEATQNYVPNDKRKVIAENKIHTVRHAYFHEYRALQYLCLLILQNQKHDFGMGMNRMYGVLFDGAWLWEEYVNTLVKDFFYHPMNKGGQGAQRLFAGNIGLIYPDFIGRNKDNRIIADAKYKPMENIGNSDYFQVIAYMMRFDAKTGLFFYPEKNGKDAVQLRLNQGTTFEKNVMPREDIHLIKHGLEIPACGDNYKDFAVQMEQAEQVFLKELYLFCGTNPTVIPI